MVMKIMTEGNFLKAKFKIKSPKITCETLIVMLLNSLRYLSQSLTVTLLNTNDTNDGELLLTANSPKF